jgi:hypothetical protein
MQQFTFRTFNLSPTPYERALADALFAIMSRRIYDPAAIAAELDRAALAPAQGGHWTAELLKSEMTRLGTWSNCIGSPVGSHALPGVSVRQPA